MTSWRIERATITQDGAIMEVEFQGPGPEHMVATMSAMRWKDGITAEHRLSRLGKELLLILEREKEGEK